MVGGPLGAQCMTCLTQAWKVDIEHLDYHHYLPIFFDGSLDGSTEDVDVILEVQCDFGLKIHCVIVLPISS